MEWERPIHFSPHERRVAWRLCHGLQNKEIAYLCGISESTVKTYLFRMYRKFGVTNRLSFVLCYLRNQDMPPPNPFAMNRELR
jgi:DNA-binding NarL/FixJ family response regulator